MRGTKGRMELQFPKDLSGRAASGVISAKDGSRCRKILVGLQKGKQTRQGVGHCKGPGGQCFP